MKSLSDFHRNLGKTHFPESEGVSLSYSIGTPAALNFRIGLNFHTFPAHHGNALHGHSRMRSNGLRVVVIGSSTLSCIAKKLQNHTFMNFEFHPAVESDMRSYSHQHYERNSNL